MPRLRLPLPRLPVVVFVVVRTRRSADVPELFSAAHRKMADGESASAKLRSAFDDTVPRGEPILSSNTIPKNNVIDRSDHEETVHTSSKTTRRQHFSTSQVPPCALSSTVEICETDNEYNEHIAQAIRVALGNSRVGALLQEPIVSGLLLDSPFKEEDVRPSPGLAPRLGPGVNFTSACRSQQDIIVPSRARNKNGTWFYVINQDNIIQTIVYEKCLRSNEKCHLGFDAPLTIQTTCKQMYIFRRKLVLDDDGLNVTEEEILMPSCCACFISKAESLESGQR